MNKVNYCEKRNTPKKENILTPSNPPEERWREIEREKHEERAMERKTWIGMDRDQWRERETWRQREVLKR